MEHRPEIDLTKITFPSDDLTLGTFRKHHRQDFDLNFPPTTEEANVRSFATSVTNILHVEREVVMDAFDRTLAGKPVPYKRHEDDQGMVDELIELYVRYGVASGEHHAHELIRDLERKGVVQAREFGGRRP